MHRIGLTRTAGFCLFILVAQLIAWAQGPGIVPPPTTTISTVQVIQFSGSVSGQPDGPLGVTFALYTDLQSTSPLFTETQTVQVTGGTFTALIGSNSSTSIPVDSFAAGTAHVLGVTVNGTEQRFLLVSVPYAMKAADTDMLGGVLAAQFVTSAQLQAALQNLPPQPSTSFTGSNSNQVVLVTQQGNGFAIQGISSGPVAILGQNSSPTGTGIQGVASSTSGQTIGVLGQSASPAGIAGAFDNTGGGRILSLRSNGNEVAGVDQFGNFHASQVQALNFVGAGFGLTNVPNSATTANSSNAANSIVARDSSGNFSAGQISALNFVGAGFGLTNVPNSATTANSSNTANSIVARDSFGNFTAGQITALNFVGSGFGLTNVPNSATTANSSNTANSIVARDSFGNFSAGQISALNFAGPGFGLTNVPNSATTATSANTPNAIVARDASGNFTTGGLNVLNQLTSAGPVDFSNAAGFTAPIRAVFSNNTPTICTASRELLIKMDAFPGQQLFICNSTGNGYLLLGDGGANGVLSVSAGDSSVTVGGTPSTPTVAVANGGITSAKLAPNAVIGNVADGSLTQAKIAGTAAILSGSNIFTGNQTVSGTLSAINLVSGSSVSGATGSFTGNTSANLFSITQNGPGAGLAVTQGNTSSFSPAISATASANGDAIDARSTQGPAVFGFSTNQNGLQGQGVTGVFATGSVFGLQASVSGSGGVAGLFGVGSSGKILSGSGPGGENFSVDSTGNLFTAGAVSAQYSNNTTFGTFVNELARLDANGLVERTFPTDTSGIVGVVVAGAGFSGKAQVAYSGVVNCLFDNATTVGHYVINSTNTPGFCLDAGAVYPSSGQVVGRALKSGSANTALPILLFGPEQHAVPGGSVTTINTGSGLTGGPISSSGTISIANAGVTNAMLQNNSVTVNAGTGLSGGGLVALGNSVTLNNTGALSFKGRTGAVVPATGDYSFAQISGSATSAQLPATVVYNNQSNTFTAPQTVNGGVTATSFSGDGSALTNVNAAAVGGLAPASLATASALSSETSARQSADSSLTSQISAVSAQSAQLSGSNAFTSANESFSGTSGGTGGPVVNVVDSGAFEALQVSSLGGIPAVFTNSGGKLISGRLVTAPGQVEKFSVDTGGNIFSAGANTQQYSNASSSPGGTTVGHLALLTTDGNGNPVVTDAPTATSAGVIGVTIGGAGSSGQAQVATSGTATCVFDGTPTAGDYVGVSHTAQGDCTDLGAAYPTSGQVIGRVLNASTGAIVLFGAEQHALPGGSVTSIATGNGLTGGPITSTGTIGIAAGGVTNAMLQSNSVTISAGQGLSGGGSIPLGGSIALSNTGVLSFNGRNGNVSPATGDYSFGQLSGSLAGSQMPALSGDVTSTAGSTATTLAPSGVTAGTYTKVTVDAKGRATSGAQAAFADLNGSVAATQMPALSGDITSAAGSTTATLATTGVTAGTYTKVTVDAKGRTTAGAQAGFADLAGTAGASQLPAAVVYNNQANTFTANQTVNGTVTATAFSGNGAAVAGVNAASLNGVASSGFAQLSAANTFTAKQTLPAASTSAASLNVPAGTAPSSPASGDVWNTGAVLQYRDNASTNHSLVSTPQSGGLQLLKLASSITPASVAVNSCSEQSFTVSGINAGDIILGVSQPSTSSPGTNVAIGGWRVTAANTVAIQFCNVGRNNSSTPVSGSYSFALMR
jgi:hypothetical protein